MLVRHSSLWYLLLPPSFGLSICNRWLKNSWLWTFFDSTAPNQPKKTSVWLSTHPCRYQVLEPPTRAEIFTSTFAASTHFTVQLKQSRRDYTYARALKTGWLPKKSWEVCRSPSSKFASAHVGLCTCCKPGYEKLVEASAHNYHVEARASASEEKRQS